MFFLTISTLVFILTINVSLINAGQIKVADVINLFISLGIIDPSKVSQAQALAKALGNTTIEGTLTTNQSNFKTVTGVNEFTRDLEIGVSGEDVKTLQKILGVNITGSYDLATKQAVINFQKGAGISPTSGIVGPKTRSVLNRILNQILTVVNSVASTSTTSNSSSNYTGYSNNTAPVNNYSSTYGYLFSTAAPTVNYSNETSNNDSESGSTTPEPTSIADYTKSLVNNFLNNLSTSYYTQSLNLSSGSNLNSNSGESYSGTSSNLVAGSISTSSTSTPWKFVESKGNDQMLKFGGKVVKVLPCLSFLGSPFGNAAAASVASGLWYVQFEATKVYDRDVINSTTTVATSTATSSVGAFSTLTSSSTSSSTNKFSNAISSSSIAGTEVLTPISTTSTTTEQKTNGSKGSVMVNLLPPKKGSNIWGYSVPASFGCYTCILSGKPGCLLFGRRALMYQSDSGIVYGI